MDETDGVINHNNSTPPKERDEGQTVSSVFEPYVSADEIASFIGEPRKNVLRMAREGTLTCYLMSGSVRHTYKFKLSDVTRDLEKLRRPGGKTSKKPSKTRRPKR